MTSKEDFERCAELIEQAEGLLITAGAGMGVDAGLPDFHGLEGFWRAYPALGKARIRLDEIASPDAFNTDPELAWGFYGHRLNLYRNTPPHDGYRILREWAGWMPQGAFVFTSNVDGLFQKAGFDAERIVECHGTIHRMQCLTPCSSKLHPAEGIEVTVDEASCRVVSPLPRCPDCGGLLRPNIMMFGDWGWLPQVTQAQQQRLEKWLDQTKRIVVVEMGAGRHIPTVRHFSQGVGMPLIRINPSDPELDGACGASLPLGALDALHAIAALLE